MLNHSIFIVDKFRSQFNSIDLDDFLHKANLIKNHHHLAGIKESYSDFISWLSPFRGNNKNLLLTYMEKFYLIYDYDALESFFFSFFEIISIILVDLTHSLTTMTMIWSFSHINRSIFRSF